MARASAEQWAKRVERWKDSGLTAKEFASETGINASTLSYWRWKLSTEAKGVQQQAERQRPAKAKRPRRPAKPVRQPEAPAFIEVPVATLSAASAALELVLGDVRVRVPVGFDEATLTRVVRAVGAAR